MANKSSFLEHKNYPTIMFLALTIISLIVLFGFVDFVDDVDKGFTAYAIQQQNITPEVPAEITEEKIGEVYTMQAWSIFYIFLISLIILVALVSIVLKRTVQKNIIGENKEGGFIE